MNGSTRERKWIRREEGSICKRAQVHEIKATRKFSDFLCTLPIAQVPRPTTLYYGLGWMSACLVLFVSFQCVVHAVPPMFGTFVTLERARTADTI